MRNVRKRGGIAGLEVAYAPHLFFTINFAAYSDVNFVLPDPQMGIASPLEDAEYLRAFSVFLSSNVFRYLLFFQSSEWGVATNTVGLKEIECVHVPVLNKQQVTQLAALHRELSEEEKDGAVLKSEQTRAFEDEGEIERTVPEEINNLLQMRIDDRVEQILDIPSNIRIITRDFMEYRYQFNKGKRAGIAANQLDDEHLLTYGRTLAHSLDVFVDAAGKKHAITLTRLDGAILCQTALVQADAPIEPVIFDLNEQNGDEVDRLWQSLKQQFSQWVYIQRSLRIFDGAKVQIFKPARLIDWTRTQALLDSDDIIGEVLSRTVEVK